MIGVFVVKKSILWLASRISKYLPGFVINSLYEFRPAAKTIRQVLNLAAPSGLTEVEISAGELAGMKMSLDLQSEKDYWLGTYEPELQAAIRDLVEPGWVAYDVGANIGYITLMLAQAVGNGGEVISFEALPSNIERLLKNVGMNSLAQNIRVIHAAVGADSGPVKFLMGPSGAMGKAQGSAGRMKGHVNAIEVPGYSLDNFVYREGNRAPNIVKMDIEGGEVLALPGMKRLLNEARPLVFLELHGPEAAKIAWESFENAAYQIARMQSTYPSVTSLDDLDWKSYLIAFP